MPNIEILRKLDDSVLLRAIKHSNSMKVERESREKPTDQPTKVTASKF